MLRDISKISVEEDDFEPYDDDIAIYFNQDYEKAVSIGIQVMFFMFKRTQFNQQYFIQICDGVYRQLQAEDKQLIRMIPPSTDKMLVLASFLQYVTSFCLHFTNDLTLSVTLTKLYLKSTKHAEIVLL